MQTAQSALAEFAQAVGHPIEATDFAAILRQLCTSFGLSNVVYLGVNVPGLTNGGIFVETTYPDDWRKHYIDNHYERNDPIVQMGLKRITPLDWIEVNRSAPKVRDFFGEAEEFGVGKQGLTFPIRGAHGEIALLSINSHHSDSEWLRLKREYMKDFQTIAFFLHNIVLAKDCIRLDSIPHITLREIECLKWAAAGKTEWETAEILKVSVKTVNFHMENVKVRLNCVTKTQAAAKATRLRLI